MKTLVEYKVWELPQVLFASEVVYISACGVFVNDLTNYGWFFFYCKLMVLWLMGVGFENTCTL